MLLKDMMGENKRIFIKSEWNQLDFHWPCVSFSQKRVGNNINSNLEPDGILVYVGVSDRKKLIETYFQSALLSAMNVKTGEFIDTKSVVSPIAWEQSPTNKGKRWKYSLPVTKSARFIGPPFPFAKDVIPNTYSQLGATDNRGDNVGNIIEVEENEKKRIMELDVQLFSENLTEQVKKFNIQSNKREESESDPARAKAIRHANRIAKLICYRVQTGGLIKSKENKSFTCPNLGNLEKLIVEKMETQDFRCALCGSPIFKNDKNPMLQPSPDRIDSNKNSYFKNNLQITHLSCNLAKNKYNQSQFNEWKNVLCNNSKT